MADTHIIVVQIIIRLRYVVPPGLGGIFGLTCYLKFRPYGTFTASSLTLDKFSLAGYRPPGVIHSMKETNVMGVM